MIPTYHLPALSHVYVEQRGVLEYARLTPDLVARQMEALGHARDRVLASRPVAEIVGALDHVARRFADPGDSLRLAAEHALPLTTGLSLPMVGHVLDRVAADWQTDRLWTLLRAEFGDPSVLDGFHARAGAPGLTRAWGPRRTFQVWSGNVPGVAVTSLVRALLVKSATFGKTAAAEPILPALFACGLAEVDAELGQCVAAAHWPGNDEMLTDAALARADAVIVYGSANTVAAVRARTPAHARFLGYGHRLSFGVIAREAVCEDTASHAAEDAAVFDQQGCVSPHLFYVEEGGTLEPRDWARLLAEAMARMERELPRGILPAHEAAAIQQLRGEAEFAEGVEVYESADGTAWTVIWDPEPAFAASCLNRTVRVKPLADLALVPDLVRPVARLLQTVGVAGPEHRLRPLAEALGSAGASRVAPVGAMAWPPPAWHHDGRPALTDLVHWCDWEAHGEAG